ncbi:hypothetical protein H0H87_010555 [Tephrocybe sp. NHM501043]|nr:hypothetical protein H0H87_010555 [Tephrocybe sp. NHM501043]
MASSDSSLVAFYKKVYAANTTPDAVTFEEVISPTGSYNTNGMYFGYDAYKGISELFFSAYSNVELSFTEFVEVPKVNGKEGEGTVAAAVHWRGDYKKGGRDEFRSHAIMHVELVDGKQMVTQIFEITDYQDTHHIFPWLTDKVEATAA